MTPCRACLTSFGLLFCLFAWESVAVGQISSALVREGEALPGDTLGASTRALNGVAANGMGGHGFTVTTDASFSHVWGNAAGGAGTEIRREGLIGTLTQTSFESFFGISDSGQVGYSEFPMTLLDQPVWTGRGKTERWC